MAAGAEFPGRWWGIGAALDALWGECGIGVVVDALWGECGIGVVVDAVGCGIDAVVDAVGCGIGVFCRRVFVDFCWWGGYTEDTYLGTFWAVRLSDPHMVGCINMAGRSRLVV